MNMQDGALQCPGQSEKKYECVRWCSAGSWQIWTNFNEILIEIQTFPFKKMQLKMPTVKWRSFYLSLNELIMNNNI